MHFPPSGLATFSVGRGFGILTTGTAGGRV